jgi:phosphatidate cytidylyltransferase
MAFLSMVFFALALVAMKRSAELSGSAARLSSMIMGVVYLGVAFPVWGLLRQMNEGNSVVMFVLAPACLTDTFAYVAGKLFGRRKFAPKVSPNKTWEGFAGALIGSVLGAWLAWRFCRLDMALVHVFGMAVVVWIVSPMGDLVESMMKRSTGVKDSGTIIPGHGGILDRLDALIFTAAAAYFYLEFVIGY